MTNSRVSRVAAALTALAISLPAPAAPCTARSPAHTAALVELYTSEGCSSCPPADRWLSSLKPAASASGRLVPLELHVDYWDDIGWKDPYASAAFTARQRAIAALQHARFVYTPQVVLQGRDFRGWNSAAFEQALAQITAQPARAGISLRISSLHRGALQVEASARVFDPARGARADLYLALYQNGLRSQVQAGENEGRMLAHDFVVRDWIGPIAFAPDGELHDRRNLMLPAGAAVRDAGVAAFVQERTTAEVLQALLLPVCPG